MNIVFVTGLYAPRYSAVGKCVKNLAAVMSQEHSVYVLSILQSDSLAPGSQGDGGETLLYACSRADRARAYVQSKAAESRHTKVWHTADRAISAWHYIGRSFSKATFESSRAKAYFRSLETMPATPDLLIPCAGMFENVMACVWYKHAHPETVLAPILFDQFANTTSLYRTMFEIRLHRRWNLQVEDEVLAASDKVFTITWEEHIRRHHSKWMDKVCHIEHPMLTPPIDSPMNAAAPSTDGAVFAGTLDPSVRTADYAIEVFRVLRAIDGKSMPFELYALGVGASDVAEASRRTPECIIAHGELPPNEMANILRSAPVLVSIGNRNTFQKPSKHVEYMAMGKPIVHFAYLQDDPAVDDLSNYPLAIVLYERDDINRSAAKLRSFMRDFAGKELTFDEVLRVFPEGTPEYVANTLIDAVGTGGLIFSGTLGASVNPEYLCQLLQQGWCSKLTASFYAGKSPMRTKLEMYGIERVVCHDWVLPHELISLQRKSCALLSIGECEGKQISSKIYEYMAVGRPVVHIYSVDGDVNLQYLSRYPLALCLKADRAQLSNNARKLALWLLWAKGRTVTFQEVEAACIDLTPAYVSRQILNEIIWAQAT